MTPEGSVKLTHAILPGSAIVFARIKNFYLLNNFDKKESLKIMPPQNRF